MPGPPTTSKGRVPTCPEKWTTRWESHERRCPNYISFYLKKSKLHFTLYLTTISPSLDCNKGERGAGVEEEVWRQPTGSGGDEVGALNWHLLHPSEVPPLHHNMDLTPPSDSCEPDNWFISLKQSTKAMFNCWVESQLKKSIWVLLSSWVLAAMKGE